MSAATMLKAMNADELRAVARELGFEQTNKIVAEMLHAVVSKETVAAIQAILGKEGPQKVTAEPPRYVSHYEVHLSDGTTLLQAFTEIQANSFGTVLEKKGVPLKAAIRMVDSWNRRAQQQGNSFVYSLPG